MPTHLINPTDPNGATRPGTAGAPSAAGGGLHAVSLCAGIGGIDLAFARAGIPTVAAVEIDEAARGVLADRFPHLTEHRPSKTLFRDLRKVSGDDLRAVGVVPERTVVTAGWPCQGNSVAGRRRGLADPRSGLWVHVARLLAELRPRWFVGENVPGLLSVNDGRDFAAVIGDLAGIGMELCWRILDARHFGVPQRRRRLIVVGHLGDQRGAPAQVLLEPDGMRGHPAPRQKARTRAAVSAGSCPAPSRQPASGDRTDGDGSDGGNRVSAAAGSDAVRAVGVLGDHTHTLTATGYDASEDGTGRGTPVIGFAWQAGGNNTASGALEYDGTPTLPKSQTLAVAYSPDVAHSLLSHGGNDKHDPSMITYVAQHVAQHASALLAAGGDRGHRIDAETAAGGQLVAFQKVIRSGARDASGVLPPEVWAERDVAATLNQHDLGSATRAVDVVVHPDVIVRRLTPLECERLQGLPDGWTATSNGKPQADSPRYQQLGNTVAVPVLKWVAHRLASIDADHATTDPAAGTAA